MDEKYVLSVPPPPEPTEKPPHRLTYSLSVAALVVALLAAGFTGWQAYEAHLAIYHARA